MTQAKPVRVHFLGLNSQMACGMLHTPERPLIFTSNPDLVDCRICDSKIKKSYSRSFVDLIQAAAEVAEKKAEKKE